MRPPVHGLRSTAFRSPVSGLRSTVQRRGYRSLVAVVTGSRYSLGKHFEAANDSIESMFDVLRYRWRQVTQSARERDEVPSLARRTAGNSKEMGVILIRPTRRTLHNIAGNGYTGAPKLLLQTVTLLAGNVAGCAIDVEH